MRLVDCATAAVVSTFGGAALAPASSGGTGDGGKAVQVDIRLSLG